MYTKTSLSQNQNLGNQNTHIILTIQYIHVQIMYNVYCNNYLFFTNYAVPYLHSVFAVNENSFTQKAAVVIIM